jgi:hypothetical protein
VGNTYAVIATATDNAANTVATPASTWTFNNTAPSAVISYPTTATLYGTNWSGAISGTSATTIPGASVSSVKLTIKDTTTNTYWNGTSWTSTAASVTTSGPTATWTYALSAANLALNATNNSYSVTATPTDNLADTSTTAPSTWTFNTTAPTAAITYPVSNVTYGSNWTGSLTGTSSTSISGATISAVNLTIKDTSTSTWWNGISWQGTSTTVPASVTGSTWSYGLSRAALGLNPMGNAYSVTATSVDSVSNSFTTGALAWTNNTVNVAITAPVSGTYGSNWTGSITGTSSTPVSGAAVSSVRLTVEDSTTGT